MDSLIHTNPTPTRSSTPASQQSISVLDAASNAQSSSTQASTPPTMPELQGVSSSIPIQDSDNFKVPEIPAAKPNEESIVKPEDAGRGGRRRSAVVTYNLKILSGTAVHSPFTKNGVRKATRDRLPNQPVRVPRVRKSIDTLVCASASAIASPDRITDPPRKVGRPFKKRRSRISNASPKKNTLQAILNRRKSAPSASTSRNADLPSMPDRAPTTSSDDIDDEFERIDSDEDEEFGTSVNNVENESGRRQSTRLLGVQVEPLVKQVLGKRSRAIFTKDLKSKRELARLLDTKEFAHIDDQPVVQQVWSNGKLVVEEKPKKKARGSAAAPTPIPADDDDDVQVLKDTAPIVKKTVKKVKKHWLEHGLYVGQTDKKDWFGGMSEEQRRQTANLPTFKPTGLMPLPMWHGQRLLHTGRNFKLPYDVCSPLAPGQPKPDGWKALMSHRKNHLVGDAHSLWKDKYQNDDSKCICSPDDGCGEGCHNREMMYECDSTNCNVGPDHCTNRSWAELERRRDPKTSNIYTIGVEVFKTVDRGFGVRANRCFEANQIIVEYTGEIITEEECDRRMNEVYKHNDCYYLMSYEQNMILDATKGSIARFVNHSCNPNCNMVKWVVKGKPRIALFALDRPIMTGEELTYDYNFNPFAANNVQECRCGSENCRGIVGPRPKAPLQDKSKLEMVKKTIKGLKAAGSTTKRKLKELMGQDVDDTDDDAPRQKKRKIAVPKPRTKSVAPAFAASVQARLANASNAIFGGGDSPRQQRAQTKDSTRNLPTGSTGSKAASTLQVAGKKGRQTTLVANSNGNIVMSKDGKRKSQGWGGQTSASAAPLESSRSPSPDSLMSETPIGSPELEDIVQNRGVKAQSQQALQSFAKAPVSYATSSRSTSDHPMHHPNIGEARIGLDEERDAFVSGTIRRIAPDTEFKML